MLMRHIVARDDWCSNCLRVGCCGFVVVKEKLHVLASFELAY